MDLQRQEAMLRNQKKPPAIWREAKKPTGETWSSRFYSGQRRNSRICGSFSCRAFLRSRKGCIDSGDTDRIAQAQFQDFPLLPLNGKLFYVREKVTETVPSPSFSRKPVGSSIRASRVKSQELVS